jgi:hypothetical protein
VIGAVGPPTVEFALDSYLNCDRPDTIFYVTSVNHVGESFPSYYVSVTVPLQPPTSISAELEQSIMDVKKSADELKSRINAVDQKVPDKRRKTKTP